MKVSNRVKRNISLTLGLLGVAIAVSRGWDVAMEPSSGKAWFELCSIVFLTFFCFSDFWKYHKRVKAGILFGPC